MMLSVVQRYNDEDVTAKSDRTGGRRTRGVTMMWGDGTGYSGIMVISARTDREPAR